MTSRLVGLLLCGLICVVMAVAKPQQSAAELNADIRRMHADLARAETATRAARRMYSSLNSVFSAFDRRFGRGQQRPLAHAHALPRRAAPPTLLEEGESVRVGARHASAIQSRLQQTQAMLQQQKQQVMAATQMTAEEPVLSDPLSEAEINQIVHGSPVVPYVDRLEHQYYHETAEDRAAIIRLKSDTNHLLNHIDFHTRRLRDNYLNEEAILLELATSAEPTIPDTAEPAHYDPELHELEVEAGQDDDSMAQLQASQETLMLAAQLDAVDARADATAAAAPSLLQEAEAQRAPVSAFTLHTDVMPAAQVASDLEVDSLLQDDDNEDDEALLQEDTMASFIAMDEEVNGKREDTATFISDAEILRLATRLPYVPPEDSLVRLKHSVERQQEVENSEIQLEQQRIDRLLDDTNSRMTYLHDRVLRNQY